MKVEVREFGAALILPADVYMRASADSIIQVCLLNALHTAEREGYRLMPDTVMTDHKWAEPIRDPWWRRWLRPRKPSAKLVEFRIRVWGVPIE